MRKYIPVYEPEYGLEEQQALMQTVNLSEFLTANKLTDRFEKEFCKHIGRRFGVMTNSGSSAVLISVAAQEWNPGDKIVTPAVTFGTTLSPLLVYGLTPVFVDVEPGTYNISKEKLADTMMREPDIKGAVIPHTLGNPVDKECFAWFYKSVEDACDALGSTIDGEQCGTFGSASAFSFFPAHHMTTIEGGMAVANHPQVHRLLFQYANWGRDCWCRAGENSVCGRRFSTTVGGVPYDHKYEFSKAGFNVRGDELRASVGLVQLKKLGKFEKTRRRNYKIIDDVIRPLEDLLIPPKSLPNADPVWFAYPITLKKGNRDEIQKTIEANGCATRLIFGGNITRHGIMAKHKYLAPHGLENSDNVMKNSFCVGINQSITEEEMYYIAKTVKESIVNAV